MNFPFVNDPATGKGSATLTVWLVIAVVALVLAVLESLAIIKTGGMISELFWGTGAMYLGRRYAFKGANVEASSNSQEKSE